MALGFTLEAIRHALRPCFLLPVPRALPPVTMYILVEVIGASVFRGVLITASTCPHLQRALRRAVAVRFGPVGGMALGFTLEAIRPAPRPWCLLAVPRALPPHIVFILVEVIGASVLRGVLIIASTCLHLQRALRRAVAVRGLALLGAADVATDRALSHVPRTTVPRALPPYFFVVIPVVLIAASVPAALRLAIRPLDLGPAYRRRRGRRRRRAWRGSHTLITLRSSHLGGLCRFTPYGFLVGDASTRPALSTRTVGFRIPCALQENPVVPLVVVTGSIDCALHSAFHNMCMHMHTCTCTCTCTCTYASACTCVLSCNDTPRD